MTILSWNYRGLGNFRTVKALEKVVKKEEPTIVLLMETKSTTEWMKNVQERCKLKHGFIVPSNGKSGGLALLWREDTVADVQTFSQTHIDAMVDGGVRVGKWHLTGFYSNLDTRKRPESWSKLKHLKGTSILPWLTIGDFNELTSLSENEGIAICRGGPKLSHLFFANDSLIFCKASLTECNSL